MKVVIMISILIIFISSIIFPYNFSLTGENESSSESIMIDGELNDIIWGSAAAFSDFVQYMPVLGGEPSEKTIVLLTHDDQNLYIGFQVYVKDKSSSYSSVLERDKDMGEDDYLEVIIDTYNNNSDALTFQTNMLGTRVDHEHSENGSVFNTSWNTIWDVQTKETEYGWSAEYSIPFSSLRFESSDDVVMGFKFIRQIKAQNEISVFPMDDPGVDNPLYNLNYAKKVSLGSISAKERILFTPYVSNNMISKYVLNSDGTAYSNQTEIIKGKDYFSSKTLDRILSNFGFDIKYKINSNTTLDLTINTDYAQAEADDRIINITRYSVLVPEKRQFFLENANLFTAAMYDHRMFNSRNIGTEKGRQVPILGGVRLTGSADGYRYGLLNMQTGAIESDNIYAKNYTVARITKNIKDDESYIGAYFTHKRSTQTIDNNSVLGIDGVYRFENSYLANGFAAVSMDNGKSFHRNLSYGFSINRYVPKGFELSYRYWEYQQNFNPELGFLPRRNFKRVTIRNGYLWRFENSLFTRLMIGNYNTFYWTSTTNEKEFTQHNMYYMINFKDGSNILLYVPMYQKDYLYNSWSFSDNVTIPENAYDMFTYHLRYISGNASNYNYGFYTILGDFYGGKRFNFDGEFNYTMNQKFGIGFTVSYNRLTFPDDYYSSGDGVENISLYTAKIKYNFSSKVSLNTYIQYDNSSHQLGSNIRFRYNFSEGSDLYIIYNQNMITNRLERDPVMPLIKDQILILKFSHTFIL